MTSFLPEYVFKYNDKEVRYRHSRIARKLHHPQQLNVFVDRLYFDNSEVREGIVQAIKNKMPDEYTIEFFSLDNLE